MNDYTPTIDDIQIAYANYRVGSAGCSWTDAIYECDRFFAAHDQGIRDTPLPPVIPDGCNLVWSGNRQHRSVFHRDPNNSDYWNGYDDAGRMVTVRSEHLIDPKLVPEEER